MVDGTGLENQHTKVSQVRILSLPPSLESKERRSLSERSNRNKNLELALVFLFLGECVRSEASLLS